MSQGACQPCPPSCQEAFDRVLIRPVLRGGTLVSWSLKPTFLGSNPLVFQLQVGTTGNPLADDWVNVGPPVVNQYMAIDPEQRCFGKTPFTHYRVRLVSGVQVYYSEPTAGLGQLSRRDWLLARELMRQRLVLYRKGYAAQHGVFLKRRWTGQPCQRCLDLATQEVRDPDCPQCYGTGRACGYFYPVGCTYALFSPKTRRVHLDGGQARGTIDDVVVQADMLLPDLVGENDIFVAVRSDQRYFIHAVQNVAEVRGVAIAGQVEMRPIPLSSIFYRIDIPLHLRNWEW